MTTNPSTTVVDTTNPTNTFSIRVMSRGKKMEINPEQIIRLQAHGNYTMIHAEASAPLMTARVLKTYVSPLEFFGFVRVNKADLVNKNKIARLEDDGRVIMKDEYVSTISRRRKSLFISLLSVIGMLLTVPVMGQNVGIGTTNPIMPLTVRTTDTTAGTPVVSLANGIIDSLYQLNATKGASTGGAGSWMTAIGQAYNGGALSEALKFYRGTGTNNGSIGITTAGAERMRIMSNGTVGVGTSSPDTLAKLDVVGKLKLADGTQATGRFLQSDSTGLASWVPITTSTILSDPVTPDYTCFREVKRTPSLSNPVNIGSNQNYVYVLNTGYPNSIRTFSLADPAVPVETSSVGFGYSQSSMAVSSDKICVLNASNNIMQVLNLAADPSHPILFGATPTDNTPADVAVRGNLAYVINYGASTFQIFDVSIQPTSALLSSINVASGPTQVFISGQYAYITRSNTQSFTIIDINDPFNPVITFENGFPANFCWDILVHNQYAYTLIQDDVIYKLRTISVEDPQAPEVVTDLNLNFAPVSMDRVGNYIVVTSYSHNKLAIFSISDPANPSLEAEIALPGGPQGITIQGLYAYVSSYISNELVTVKLGCKQTISINSLSGESTASTMWESNGSSIFTHITKVGIGTNTSHALLQLDNTLDNRKLVLFETNNNDHEFLGFGINPGMLRYQTANAGDDHVFFSGIDSTSSTELMRITGDGLVGIGTATPVSKLDLGGNLTIGQGYAGTNAAPVNGAIIEGNVGIGTTTPASKLDLEGNLAVGVGYAGAFPAPVNGAIIEGNVGIGTIFPHAPLQFGNVASNRKIILSEAENNDHRFRGFGNNPNELRYQVAYPSDNHVFYSGSSSSSSTELLRITGSGEVGIGTSTPHAQLQLGNTLTNRKLVLYESADNDHQYFGLGSNTNILRYQVAGAADNHAFFSGIDPGSSKELMRITGGGFVGIGTTTPHALLQLANASANRKIVLSELGNNDHQFMGFGNQADMLRYQVNSNAVSHVFFAGSGAGASNELMRITGFGSVGIGTSTPVSKLDVEGNLTVGAGYGGSNAAPVNGAIVEGSVGIGTNAPVSKLDVEGNLTIGAGYGGSNAAPVNGALIEGSVGIGTNAPVSKLDVEGNLTVGAGYGGTNAGPVNGAIIEGKVGIGISNPASKLDIGGNLTIGTGYGGSSAAPVNGAIIEGNVGIGTSTPHAQLQLGNTITNRKMVLYETTNNDHEYLGFGINLGMLRYQVANANDNHVFFSGINSTSSKELMRITGNGEVGIGTTTPHALLQLANTISNRKLVLFENGNNDHQYFGLGINANSMRYQVASASDNHVFYSGFSSTTSKELMRITGSGLVGIGTTAPTFPLTVRTSTNTEGARVASLATAITDTMFQLNVSRGSITNGVGSWMTAIGQSYNGGALTEAIKFLRGAYTYDGALAFMTNAEERMRITSSGAIGIGTTTPQGPLHVAANGMTAPAQDRNYFTVNTGSFLVFNNSASGNVQIIADGYFWANGGGFIATSDQRIKNIKGLSDTKKDLATLNAIEVTDYTYIDSIQNGNTPQKKVIAQQLQHVYPQAVNTNKGIIPSVFEVASSSQVVDQHTIITTSKAHDFTDGDQVRLILEGKGEKVVHVDVIDEKTFKVEEAIPGRIFVYGKHVDDLLNVDYDAVAMLNVSATQELYKMILELKAENEQLRQDLESRLAKVEARKEGGL